MMLRKHLVEAVDASLLAKKQLDVVEEIVALMEECDCLPRDPKHVHSLEVLMDRF
jgi:hypothetical protein